MLLLLSGARQAAVVVLTDTRGRAQSATTAPRTVSRTAAPQVKGKAE